MKKYSENKEGTWKDLRNKEEFNEFVEEIKSGIEECCEKVEEKELGKFEEHIIATQEKKSKAFTSNNLAATS